MISRVLSFLGLRPLRSGGAILCFHGVTTPEQPAEGVVHLPLAQFERIVGAARELGRLVPLSELVGRHRTGRGTAGLVALTADDAYASLLHAAGDFLRREAVPITLFVVAGAAAGGSAYWWDRVDDLFPRVPTRRWWRFENECGMDAGYRDGQPAEFGPLRPFRQWLLATHAGRWPARLEPLLARLEADAGVQTRQRAMSFAELEAIAGLDGVEFGVHTVSHPVLPLLSDAELEWEVAECHRALRERFARTVAVLAVPFGLFDARTVAVARAAGMRASLTLAARGLGAHPAPADLPRFCVTRDDTATKLTLHLTEALDRFRARGAGMAPRYPALPSATT